MWLLDLNQLARKQTRDHQKAKWKERLHHQAPVNFSILKVWLSNLVYPNVPHLHPLQQ